jgi:drug/metabolite transporter (DMT)-like permease
MSATLTRRAARTALWLGTALVIAYDLVSGGNEVFVANRLQTLDPVLLLTLSTAIAVAVFNAVQVRRWALLVRQVRADLGLVGLLNLISALTWVSFFVALKYAEPALVAAVCAAVAPMLTIVMARWIRPGSSVLAVEWLVAAGILTLLVASWYVSTAGRSGAPSASPALGIGASLVCGVGIAMTPTCSKRLYDVGWRATQVMAVRFWALLALTAVAVAAGGRLHESSGLVDVGAAALVTAVVGTVGSLYLLQLGIERLEPVTVALLLAAGPLFTLALQAFDPRLHPSPASAAIVCLVAALVAFTVIARDRAERLRVA